MSDQDNLRDRIAEIFYHVGNGLLALNMSPNERNDLAQAIIDELHLFAEVDEDWGAMVIEGWWEKQCPR